MALSHDLSLVYPIRAINLILVNTRYKFYAVLLQIRT